MAQDTPTANSSETLGASTEGFSAIDINLPTTTANAAEITLTERYPENGFALNTRSEMIVRILEGGVVFICDGSEKILQEGSVIIVPINKPYCWMPQEYVKLYTVSTPPWTAEQHRNVNTPK